MSGDERTGPSLLDRIESGLLSREQFEQEVINQVYAGLHRYCEIPAGYQDCRLATREMDLDAMADVDLRALLKTPSAEIINPHRSQIKAIELFELLLSGDPLTCDHGDPLSPTVGAYLYGPPGSGKTHLMAAYGLRVKAMLDEKLESVRAIMGDTIERAYLRYNERRATESDTEHEMGYLEIADENSEEIREALSPEREFWLAIGQLEARLAEHDYQPTDLIYIGFKELIELCMHSSERRDAMSALQNARVVFIDDVHPQGDPEQIQIVLHLLERRYEMGRAGTFLTTNLETRQLGGGDEVLGNRLLSRCAETLVTIDFSDCEDWRRKVKSRRVRIVEEELERRMAAHRHVQDDSGIEEIEEPDR